MKANLIVLLIASLSCAVAAQGIPETAFASVSQSPSQASLALVTFYSSGTIKGLTLGTGTRSAWHGGTLFDGEQRLLKRKAIVNHRFITLKMKPGEHAIAGEAFALTAKPSHDKNILTFEGSQRYFVKLSIVHKGWGVYGSFRYYADIVPCEQAYAEAATAEPVKAKHLDKVAAQMAEPQMYFPKCD